MSEQTDQEIIREYADRPRRYINIDGHIELYWGLCAFGMCLLAGAGRLAPRQWHAEFVLAKTAWPVVVWLGLKALRRQVTDRRTGFVQYRRRWPSKPWEYLLCGAAIAGFCFILCWYGRFFMTTAFGATASATLYAIASRLDRLWKWAILLAMAAGPLILQWEGMDVHKQPLLWIAFLGLLWTIGGAVSFWLYLRGSRALKEDRE